MINHTGLLRSQYITSPESDFTFNAETKTITGYVGDFGNVIIPSTINSVVVEHIGDRVFGIWGPEDSLLTSITIPNSVITIGDSSFYGCNNLTSVTFGRGLTEIDDFR